MARGAEPERPAGGRGAEEFASGVEPAPVAASFLIEECGLSNRQVWSAMLDELRAGGDRASVDTWLRDAAIVGRGEDGALVVGVPHELARRRVADRFVTALRRSVTTVVGVALPVEVVLTREWLAAHQGEGEQPGSGSGPKASRCSG